MMQNPGKGIFKQSLKTNYVVLIHLRGNAELDCCLPVTNIYAYLCEAQASRQSAMSSLFLFYVCTGRLDRLKLFTTASCRADRDTLICKSEHM